MPHDFLHLSSADDLFPRDIDYYGVTFDHLVPTEDVDPDVLKINIIEMETDDGPFAHGAEYANKYLLFPVDPADCAGKKILATPRCCSTRKGSQDWGRINGEVAERDSKVKEAEPAAMGGVFAS